MKGNMFGLKMPCKDCPFRKDGVMLKSLSEGRMEEIVNNVVKEDGFFPCHKTIDYTKRAMQDKFQLQEQNQFCAGALIAIEKAGARFDNVNTRIAYGFKIYDPDKLNDKYKVIEPKDYL